MQPPAGLDDWVALSAVALDPPAADGWVRRPGCGAVVTFSGTVRDHAQGRRGVTGLDYEAWAEQAEVAMAEVVAEVRRRHRLGRVVLWHRTGSLVVSDTAVVVAVSSPHRAEAFDAARWVIDTVKATVPIWKQETWDGGRGWGTSAEPIAPVGTVA